MLTVIWTAIRNRAGQSVATFLAVCLSTALIVSLATVYQGMTAGFSVSRERLGADVLAVPHNASEAVEDTDLLFAGATKPIYMDASITDTIAGLEDIEQVSEQFYGMTIGGSECCSGTASYHLIGIDPETDWVVSSWLGSSAALDLDGGKVVAGAAIQNFPEGKGRILGRDVEVGATLDYSGTSMDNSVFMHIDTLRELMAAKEEYQQYWADFGSPDTLVSAVLVKAEEGHADHAARHILFETDDVETLVMEDTYGELQGQMGLLFNVMVVIAVLLLVATAFQLFAQFFGIVWERRQQLGLYRALGATNAYLGKMIAGEAGLLVGAGVVVGLALAPALSLAVVSLLQGTSAFPFIMPGAGTIALDMLLAAVVFAALGAIATSVPLRQTKRVDASLAMQHDDID